MKQELILKLLEMALIDGNETCVKDISADNSLITDSLLGKYVIVRSRNEGLNSGFISKADSTGIILNQARRIWWSRPKDTSQCWYEGIANTGVSEDSKLSAPVEQKVIIEDYSITVCSETAIKSISGAKAHEQS